MVAEHGATWNLSPCLIDLMHETDRLFPGRSTASDGSIGDPAHAARVSDHNPSLPRPPGWVNAVDITDDDAAGCDVGRLVHHLVASRDRRVKYVIFNNTIWKAYASGGVPAWTPTPYTGVNPHTKHVHVSIQPGERFYTGAWWAAADVVPGPVPVPQPKEDDEMLIIKAPGKPTRLLAPPLFVILDTQSMNALILGGVKVVAVTEVVYDAMRDQVIRALDET